LSLKYSEYGVTVRQLDLQWETSSFCALRRKEVPEEWASKPRAEVFDLTARSESEDASGTAWFSLSEQVITRAALARDREDLEFATKAWLTARGARSIALCDETGAVISRRPFSVTELSSRSAAETPQRVITLCPSNAELVEALGCFDRVIACENSSDWPVAVEKVERLGPDLSPDLDRVAALAPDLVLSSLSVPGMERVVTGLRRRGVDQLVLAPRRISDVLADVLATARRLGVGSRGRDVRQAMERERDALRSRSQLAPVRVYLEWWPRPMFTPGSGCYSNELIALAGGVNVFQDREGASVEITPEELLRARPDVCFVSWCGVSMDKLDPGKLIERPGLAQLRAGRRGHVYRLDERFSGRPGPRMLEAARQMAAAIERVRQEIELGQTAVLKI
jgi:iron complex transport system substrate-binding protein